MEFAPSVRRVVAGVAVLTIAAGLASCSNTPDARPAATALAEAVASGSFEGVPVANVSAVEAAAAVEQLTGNMGGATRTVEVQDVQETEDGQRQATLGVTWDLDGSGAGDSGGWTYTTTAPLSLAGDVWEVQWSPEIVHPELTGGDQLVMSHRQAERAEVLGAGGAAIVTEHPVYRIGIDKAAIGERSLRGSARTLADLVGVDLNAYADRVEAAGPRAFVEAISLREAEARPVLPQVEDIPGARAIESTLALAPTREFARPILGTVGEATAEIVEASGGAIGPGDVVGLSGLQQQYDEQLRGVPGFVVELVRAVDDGDSEDEAEAEPEPEIVFESEPQPGQPVTTTLDPDLQVRAEEVLAGVGPPSALVAVQPSTGNVLAAASGPGGDGYATATLAQHAPGSTFKIVTALALLRAGMAPDSALECPPTTVVDGRSFKNYGDYPASALGTITFREAIANSCNTALIGQHQTVTQADLAGAAASLGLGVEYAAGVPAYGGAVPSDASATEHAASMIGQGKVLASPLAMATVAASVAAGRTVTPTIVEGGADATGAEDGNGDGDGDGEASAAPSDTPGPPSDTPAAPSDTPGPPSDTPAAPSENGEAATGGSGPPLSAQEAGELQALMRAVVEGGSGTFLADVPGEPVGAKTGTAEYGTDNPPRTHGWMIATQGDLAVAAFVEDAASGARTAGPLLETFLAGR